MRVIDKGHHYSLTVFDGYGTQELRFMKREGPGYPYNVGAYPGTNCQEVLRALIDRTLYLDGQVPCAENSMIVGALRTALFLFESRAARRHGRHLGAVQPWIECEPVSDDDGHIHKEDAPS